MPWTQPPRTWTDGEPVTATILNRHLRDQFNATWHLCNRKTSDQTVTNSTALVDCTGISQAVGANDIWVFQAILRFTGAATSGDFKGQFVGPAGGRSEFSLQGFADATPTEQGVVMMFGGNTFNWFGDITDMRVYAFPACYIGGANSGTFQFQFAQQTANANGNTIKANSALYGIKLN